jgi:hypothetical protein
MSTIQTESQMALFHLGSQEIVTIKPTSFVDLKVKERGDLQRLLRTQVNVIDPDLFVLTEEFSQWENSSRRIDLLAIDRSANLVVIELKRADDGSCMDLQAIRYAAMVSAMTWEQAVKTHGEFLQKLGISEEAEERMLQFLNWPDAPVDDFGEKVKIMLVSADFSPELTTAVMWLNSQGLDIRCIRMVPYAFQEQTLVDIQQVIPPREAEKYQVQLREKAAEEQASRQQANVRAERYQRFWAGLLKLANPRLPLHRMISPSRVEALCAENYGMQFNYVLQVRGARVELYICRGSKDENKAIFDDLQTHEQEIADRFGGPLEWQRLEDRNVCRICASVDGGTIIDESTWGTVGKALVDSMERFFHAMQPFVEEYRKGGIPPLNLANGTVPPI